jgi:hypothetical protein
MRPAATTQAKWRQSIRHAVKSGIEAPTNLSESPIRRDHREPLVTSRAELTGPFKGKR